MLLEIELINDEVMELVEETIVTGEYLYLSSSTILMWEQDYFANTWLHDYVEYIENFVNSPHGDYQGV